MNNVPKKNHSAIKTVLFLCTGNSCRSQIAEALVNSRLPDRWMAFSAGIKPSGFVHPLTAAVLEEIGITHDGWSKNVTHYSGIDFDLIVTVCNSAADDCPVWLLSGTQFHIAFDDPALFVGDEDFMLSKFRQVRDEISIKIPGLLARYE